MKLEVGKYYKTRDGRKARVTSVKGSTADIEIDDGCDGVVFAENGMADIYPGPVHGSETSYDLIEEWKDDWSEWVDKDQTERRDGNNFVSKSYGVHNVSVISEVGEYETSIASPIQQKIVKELVPGVYGKINVGWIHNNKASLGFDRSYLDSDVLKHATVMHELSSSELRAAAKTFNEIAEYLEENA